MKITSEGRRIVGRDGLITSKKVKSGIARKKCISLLSYMSKCTKEYEKRLSDSRGERLVVSVLTAGSARPGFESRPGAFHRVV